MLSLARSTVRQVARNGRSFAARSLATDAVVYANYNVYKPDHFEVKPIPPVLKALSSVYGQKRYTVQQAGKIMLSIAPFDGKQVAWDRKVAFALNPTESAAFMDVHNTKLGSMVLKRTGADDESMRMFEARVDPDESGGVLIFMQEEAGSTVHVSLTKDEFSVVKSIVDYSIPRLCAMDFFFDTATKEAMRKADREIDSQSSGADGPPSWAL